MENELSQVHKTKIIYQTFFSNLMWYFFTGSALTRRATRGGTFGAFVPPKFSKHCTEILTFAEPFKR